MNKSGKDVPVRFEAAMNNIKYRARGFNNIHERLKHWTCFTNLKICYSRIIIQTLGVLSSLQEVMENIGNNSCEFTWDSKCPHDGGNNWVPVLQIAGRRTEFGEISSKVQFADSQRSAPISLISSGSISVEIWKLRDSACVWHKPSLFAYIISMKANLRWNLCTHKQNYHGLHFWYYNLHWHQRCRWERKKEPCKGIAPVNHAQAIIHQRILRQIMPNFRTSKVVLWMVQSRGSLYLRILWCWCKNQKVCECVRVKWGDCSFALSIPGSIYGCLQFCLAVNFKSLSSPTKTRSFHATDKGGTTIMKRTINSSNVRKISV